jgi:hypothetical protein
VLQREGEAVESWRGGKSTERWERRRRGGRVEQEKVRKGENVKGDPSCRIEARQDACGRKEGEGNFR